LSFLSNNMLLDKNNFKQFLNKGKSKSNPFSIYIYLFQSLVPHSLVTIYIGGIFIFLYKSYYIRVPNIRKYKQTIIESKKKRETNMRMRGQKREERVFLKKKNEFSRDLYNAIRQIEHVY